MTWEGSLRRGPGQLTAWRSPPYLSPLECKQSLGTEQPRAQVQEVISSPAPVGLFAKTIDGTLRKLSACFSLMRRRHHIQVDEAVQWP